MCKTGVSAAPGLPEALARPPASPCRPSCAAALWNGLSEVADDSPVAPLSRRACCDGRGAWDPILGKLLLRAGVPVREVAVGVVASSLSADTARGGSGTRTRSGVLLRELVRLVERVCAAAVRACCVPTALECATAAPVGEPGTPIYSEWG